MTFHFYLDLIVRMKGKIVAGIALVIAVVAVNLALIENIKVKKLRNTVRKAERSLQMAKTELKKAQEDVGAAKNSVEERIKAQTAQAAQIEVLTRQAADARTVSDEKDAQIADLMKKLGGSAPGAPASPNVLPTELDELQRRAEKAEAELSEAKQAQGALNRIKREPEKEALNVKALVKVFYGTDRNVVRQSDSGAVYGIGRGDGIRYGTCEVSVPRDHKMGDLESPSIWRLEFKPNPEKHVVLRKTNELSKQVFFEMLKTDVASAESKEVFVFVHGFANSFEDAAQRTAQLSYDLGYRGIPMMYTWPSRGKIGLSDYRYDETNIEWTAPHLEQFLCDIAQSSGAEHINLIAHSMGNKILGDALTAAAVDLKDRTEPTFGQVVLTAPDIDADVFKNTLAPAISKLSNRLTLYASSKDRALQFSRKIHGNYPRAGDSTPKIVLGDGFDSIDVSRVDTYFFGFGHSYFGDNRSVISDLFLLFRDGSPPEKRNLLLKLDGQLRYWLFRP